MRVLHLISSAGFYGAENALVSLAAASQKAGACRPVVGVLRDARNPHQEAADQARQRGLEAEVFACSGRLDPRTIRAIRRKAQEMRVDLMHSHGYKSNFYAYLAARPVGIPVLATCHTGTDRPEMTAALRLYDWLDRGILRRVNQVVAVSPAIAEVLRQRGIPAERIAVVPNGVDVERFRNARPALALPEGAKAVGMVGRLTAHKGPDCFLEAASIVAVRIPEARFVLVGDGPERSRLERAAAQSGFGDRIVFTGVRHDMPAVYASLSVFALPSYSEGLPMSVLEAMAAGVPVIASRVGAIPQLIESERDGLLVHPGAPAKLAEAIVRVLEHPAWAQELSRSAQQRVMREYSSESMARRYQPLYESLCRSGRGRSVAGEVAP